MLTCQDTDRDTVSMLVSLALLVSPQEGDTAEAKAANIADFASRHQRYLEALIDGTLTVEAAGEAVNSQRDF